MTPTTSVDDASGWTVVAGSGELDVSSAPRLRAQIIETISAGRRHLVVDLTLVTFIDTTGLSVLIGALKRIRLAGGQLRVVTSADHVLRTLRVTGLNRVFETYPCVADAVRPTASPSSPPRNTTPAFRDVQV